MNKIYLKVYDHKDIEIVCSSISQHDCEQFKSIDSLLVSLIAYGIRPDIIADRLHELILRIAIESEDYSAPVMGSFNKNGDAI